MHKDSFCWRVREVGKSLGVQVTADAMLPLATAVAVAMFVAVATAVAPVAAAPAEALAVVEATSHQASGRSIKMIPCAISTSAFSKAWAWRPNASVTALALCAVSSRSHLDKIERRSMVEP